MTNVSDVDYEKWKLKTLQSDDVNSELLDSLLVVVNQYLECGKSKTAESVLRSAAYCTDRFLKENSIYEKIDVIAKLFARFYKHPTTKKLHESKSDFLEKWVSLRKTLKSLNYEQYINVLYLFAHDATLAIENMNNSEKQELYPVIVDWCQYFFGLELRLITPPNMWLYSQQKVAMFEFGK